MVLPVPLPIRREAADVISMAIAFYDYDVKLLSRIAP